jgi:UDP-3-O-[3-hydroxymyristoyl] glucosamine N-acyltransferase
VTVSRVGDDSVLYANVVVYYQLRDRRRAIIHAGAVIGADGFGFARDGERWVKIPQIGRVVIGDDVEIGANTSIDRGLSTIP